MCIKSIASIWSHPQYQYRVTRQSSLSPSCILPMISHPSSRRKPQKAAKSQHNHDHPTEHFNVECLCNPPFFQISHLCHLFQVSSFLLTPHSPTSIQIHNHLTLATRWPRIHLSSHRSTTWRRRTIRIDAALNPPLRILFLFLCNVLVFLTHIGCVLALAWMVTYTHSYADLSRNIISFCLSRSLEE